MNSVAGLLKQFFRDLPDPLLTKEHYSAFIEAASELPPRCILRRLARANPGSQSMRMKSSAGTPSTPSSTLFQIPTTRHFALSRYISTVSWKTLLRTE